MTTITLTVTLNSKLNNGGGGGPLPPSNTVAPVISGSSVIGSTLTSTTGTWTGTPVITYAYQWKRNGGNIGGATSSTYILVNADYNNAITCEVTATNIAGSASATSNSITGTAAAPSNIVPPVLSGTNVVGQTLSCTTGTWTGTPTPTYSYTWYRGASVISGATASTYTLVQADATFVITCVVVATNAAGSLGSTSNSLTILDADADAFITAANITDNTQRTAINQLVVGLKAYNIWSKMKAIYPFVGGSASTHKWNLKDPRDLDAAFRLVFSGGITHDLNGITGNGVNGEFNTFYNDQTENLLDDVSLSAYSRTDLARNSDVFFSTGGLGAASVIYINPRNGSNAYTAKLHSVTQVSVSNNNSSGLYTISRLNSIEFKAYRNTNINIAPIVSSSSDNLYVIGFKFGSVYSQRNLCFMQLGLGLTDTDATNLYNTVQTFQTSLSRQV